MKRKRKILLKPQNQRGANWRRMLRTKWKLKKRRKRKMNLKMTRRERRLRQTPDPNQKLRRKRPKSRRKRNKATTASLSPFLSLGYRLLCVILLYYILSVSYGKYFCNRKGEKTKTKTFVYSTKKHKFRDVRVFDNFTFLFLDSSNFRFLAFVALHWSDEDPF